MTACVPPLDRVTVFGVKESPYYATIDGNSILEVAFDGDKHTINEWTELCNEGLFLNSVAGKFTERSLGMCAGGVKV